ncbi:MAG TPA: gamma-glutamyl-gamma-aminobutyrate hydrolase family protein [Chloroflexota bacterium]|nr:gamma-glutamyl-gamma-aminobutyrate hydrolase family protein [Chloroflexota bacterium]
MATHIGVSFIRDEVVHQNYLNAIREAGAEPVVLTSAATLPQWPTADEAASIFDPSYPAIAQLDELDGLLLTGGGDIDPMLFGEVMGGSQIPYWPRDHVELAQFRRARRRNLPVFGICRGIQFLNVAMGGSLVQHLPTSDKHRHATPGRTRSHLVKVAADSVLGRIIAGETPDEDLVLGVNSYHHQGVTRDRIAPSLVPTAMSAAIEDESEVLLEAVESEGTRAGSEWVLGVQWHPERVGDETPWGPGQVVPFREASRRLFRAFVAAAERRRSGNERQELVALQVQA